jgi:hypothetical protein
MPCQRAKIKILLHTKNSKYYFRYRNILDVPQVRTTTYGKRSFRYSAASLWNSLPDHFRTENSFAHFRSLAQSCSSAIVLIRLACGVGTFAFSSKVSEEDE